MNKYLIKKTFEFEENGNLETNSSLISVEGNKELALKAAIAKYIMDNKKVIDIEDVIELDDSVRIYAVDSYDDSFFTVTFELLPLDEVQPAIKADKKDFKCAAKILEDAGIDSEFLID